jgi:hypothetical protein
MDATSAGVYDTRMGITWIAAIGAFLSAVVLWNMAMVAALRPFGIKLASGFPFHFYTRQRRELLAALQRRPKGTYILVSGFLLFACPLFLGFAFYDFILQQYVDHSKFGPRYVDALVGSFIIFAICGVWNGLDNWKRSAEEQIHAAH